MCIWVWLPLSCEMHTRGRCVGTCECGVNLHVDCAKASDFICIVQGPSVAPAWADG